MQVIHKRINKKSQVPQKACSLSGQQFCVRRSPSRHVSAHALHVSPVRPDTESAKTEQVGKNNTRVTGEQAWLDVIAVRSHTRGVFVLRMSVHSENVRKKRHHSKATGGDWALCTRSLTPGEGLPQIHSVITRQRGMHAGLCTLVHGLGLRPCCRLSAR